MLDWPGRTFESGISIATVSIAVFRSGRAYLRFLADGLCAEFIAEETVFDLICFDTLFGNSKWFVAKGAPLACQDIGRRSNRRNLHGPSRTNRERDHTVSRATIYDRILNRWPVLDGLFRL
jgi:hypothetical protein